MKKKYKYIAVTTREIRDEIYSYDSLDNKWPSFFEECNLIPVYLPNNLFQAKEIINDNRISGYLLTGGGDIRSGIKPNIREEIEELLINNSIHKNIPLIGVCRGMQKIQDFFNIPIKKVKGHVSDHQKIIINDKYKIKNSYHNFGTNINSEEFRIWAVSDDGIIKAIIHKDYNISGVMWHPERLKPFHDDDINFFKKTF